MSESNLKQKTKVGIFWNLFEKIIVQIISFVLNIILARLLSPTEYGTLGLLSVFLIFSNVFVESGFSRALIQKRDCSEYDFSTTLIFNIAISCFLYAILFLCSPLIASFYKIPALVQIQRVFFLVIILNSLSVVQSAKLQIMVDFKSIAAVNSITTIVSGVIAVICAFWGLGIWALVIQALLKAGVSSVCFWFLGHWVPKTSFSVQSFKQLFGFGSKLLVSGLLATGVSNLYNLVIGKLYDTERLGFYTRAQQFPELTSGTINSVFNTATFPLMSSIKDNREDLVVTFTKLIRIVAMVVFPAMMGLAVLSKPIILVLLGEKWSPAAGFLFWLALSYIFTPLGGLNLSLLNAIGRSDLFLKVDMSKVPLILLTMAITFPVSLEAVVIGQAIVSLVYFYINAFMTGRLYNFGCFKQLLVIWKYIFAATCMAILVYFISLFFSTVVISLIIGIVSGIIIYCVLLLILQDEEFLFFLHKIIHRMHG